MSSGNGADPVRTAQRLMRPELPRRFYKEVGVATRPEGETLLLDGRPARTPAKRPLALPSRRLAEAVAEEWRAQEGVIDPAGMPLTRLVNIVIDGVVAEADRVREEVARYAGSDLLCYRASEPEGLVAWQESHWNPLLRWAEEALGAPLRVGEGVAHVSQDAASMAAVRAAIRPLDPYRLAALHVITSLCGSAVIALALLFRRIDADEAWAAAHVDEDWNRANWGEDAEAAARRAFRRTEMDAAVRLLQLL